MEMMEASKYALCPRGVGAASMRLFEAMKMGVAPIIVSDEWIMPNGPDWSRCSIRVKEKDVRRIHEIALENESRYVELGKNAKDAYDRYFTDRVYFNYLVDQMIDLTETQSIPEQWFWKMRNAAVVWWKIRQRILSP